MEMTPRDSGVSKMKNEKSHKGTPMKKNESQG